jgi:hypothetical protein
VRKDRIPPVTNLSPSLSTPAYDDGQSCLDGKVLRLRAGVHLSPEDVFFRSFSVSRSAGIVVSQRRFPVDCSSPLAEQKRRGLDCWA